MDLVGAREFRNHLSRYLARETPLLLTRHGKVSGLCLPLDDASRVPDDLRRELAAALGAYLARLLEEQGVGEEERARGPGALSVEAGDRPR